MKRLLLLTHDGKADPWSELGRPRPTSLSWENWPLAKAHMWTAHQERDLPCVILIDIDAVARTQPLDDWAVDAWRQTFNALVGRAVNKEGRAPLVMGFTREPTWESGRLAARLGARDIERSSRLEARLSELLSLSLPPSEAEVVPMPAPKLERGVLQSGLPKHAIPFPVEGLEGESPAIEQVRALVRKCAPLETPVLILGETGSGKERVARTLHRYSARMSGPFVAVNCGALAPGVVESELFGHVKGAFTGATSDRTGYLAAARGGTLFLDEVSELSLDVQVKLLRALQERSITPVGSSKAEAIDFRLVCATQENLAELSTAKRFREDLLYRIRVMEIMLPALRHRRGDIPELCDTLLKRLARRHKKSVLAVSSAALDAFLRYEWPGNVRELENTLEHAATLCWAEALREIEIVHLPHQVQAAENSSLSSDQHLKDAVLRFEREFISRTVQRMGGSKEEAADALGLSLATLYRKLGSSR